MRKLLFFVCTLTLFLPVSLEAQNYRLSAQVGTIGVGGGIAVGINDYFDVRGGLAFLPYERDMTLSDIEYAVEFPSPNGLVVLDFFPAGRRARLTGGLFYSLGDAKFSTSALSPIRIGARDYLPLEIGIITGELKNSDLAPYFGVGLGDPMGIGVGFFLDVGMAFRSAPEVTMKVTGTKRNDADFQEQLDAERKAIAEDSDVKFFQNYLVISLGFRVR
jgi:hypothetical protein